MRDPQKYNEQPRDGLYISQDMYFIFDKEGKFLDYQTKDPALLLIPPEKLMNKHFYEVFPDNLTEIFKDAFQRVNSTGEFQIISYSIPVKDGQNYQEVLLIPDGNDRIIAVVKDVTRSVNIRKMLEANEEFSQRLVENITTMMSGIGHVVRSSQTPEEYLMALSNLKIEVREKFIWELLNSEDRFRTIFENSPVGIAIGMQGRFLQVNKAYAKIYGFDNPSEISGTPIVDRVAPEFRNEAVKKMQENQSGNFFFSSSEQYGTKKDGTTFPIHADLAAVRLFEGNAVMAFITDMTEIVSREERIRASLKEKEILLKEVHHRVKNNLQIISSMLSLQSDLVNSENYLNAFNDSRDRVRSMAIIHEKLYQSENFSSIDFGEYAIELINYLYKTYWISSEEIKIRYDLDPVFLTIDRAIPCGLILNELVSNALKYAFMPGRQGVLSFSMRTDGIMTTMKVKDNGPGLPQEKSIEKPATLGLMVVNTLILQLNGTIEVKNENGAEFIITFNNEVSS